MLVKVIGESAGRGLARRVSFGVPVPLDPRPLLRLLLPRDTRRSDIHRAGSRSARESIALVARITSGGSRNPACRRGGSNSSAAAHRRSSDPSPCWHSQRRCPRANPATSSNTACTTHVIVRDRASALAVLPPRLPRGSRELLCETVRRAQERPS